MMNKTIFRNVLMLPGLICGVCGCQEEVVTVPAVAIDIPQEFSADGAQWTVIEMGASEERVLGDFFAKNDDLMGSPDFQGYPSVFVSSTQDLRFYWLHPAVDGCRWHCAEKRDGKFDVHSGSGNPFEEKEKEKEKGDGE